MTNKQTSAICGAILVLAAVLAIGLTGSSQPVTVTVSLPTAPPPCPVVTGFGPASGVYRPGCQ